MPDSLKIPKTVIFVKICKFNKNYRFYDRFYINKISQTYITTKNFPKTVDKAIGLSKFYILTIRPDYRPFYFFCQKRSQIRSNC